MRSMSWEMASQASRADVEQEGVLRDWLVARGWALKAPSPRLLRRFRPPQGVRFGWDETPTAIRLVSGPLPARSRSSDWSNLVVVPDETLGQALAASGINSGQLRVVPFPVPDRFFDWADMGAVFDVTRRYRLEHRPRIVAEGTWERGDALTRLLPAARRVLSQGGELVLLNAYEARARIAPAVSAVGLQEAVVYLPALSVAELAGLYRSADLFLQLDAASGFPALMRWALATGLPAVGIDHELTRGAGGAAFLAVDPLRNDAWPDAVRQALMDGRIREEIMRRAVDTLWDARLSCVGPLLETVFEGVFPPAPS